MRNTKIEWCDDTWNPVTGCRHGCRYCYARKSAERFSSGRESDDDIHVLYEPVLDEKGKKEAYPFGFEPTFYRYRLLDYAKKPDAKPRTIFVGSMGDLFGEWVPDFWIKDVFNACMNAPQHTYMFLTKNPKRYGELRQKGLLPEDQNMLFGTSVTDQQSFDKNLKLLRDGTHFFSNTFLSIEPLLGPIDPEAKISMNCCELVIIGAETGAGAKEHVPERRWIEDIVEYRHKEGLPVFMKDSLIPIWGKDLIRERAAITL